jgi:DNA-binding transcriptional ArsR family regulator
MAHIVQTVQEADIASVARVIGERARAIMLTALLDGRALTTGELAQLAAVGAPAASEHLGKLLDAGLVSITARGRHRYYRLAGPEVAAVLEALSTVAEPVPARTLRQSAAARALKPARLCYDHLAGELGVAVAEHLGRIHGLSIESGDLGLTDVGSLWFADLGVDLASASAERRPFLRRCLDWTERRDHLAGAAAAALARTALDQEWVRRRSVGERGLIITPLGRRTFADLLVQCQ